RQEILINFGDLVISFLGSLVDIVLRTGIGSFIFGLDALIFLVHGGPISINDESCKKRPLEGVTYVLERSRPCLDTRPLPPCETKEGNHDNSDEHKMPPPGLNFIPFLTHMSHLTDSFQKALFP